MSDAGRSWDAWMLRSEARSERKLFIDSVGERADEGEGTEA